MAKAKTKAKAKAKKPDTAGKVLLKGVKEVWAVPKLAVTLINSGNWKLKDDPNDLLEIKDNYAFVKGLP